MSNIVDVYHEWDDPHAFRVYLVREGGPEEGEPMEAVYAGDSVECRLFRAAFVKCHKDLGPQDACDRVLGFEKEAAAKRVAAAVKKELKAIEKGAPAMSDEQFSLAVQIAKMLAPKRRTRG
jgi:hypothetical protein